MSLFSHRVAENPQLERNRGQEEAVHAHKKQVELNVLDKRFIFSPKAYVFLHLISVLMQFGTGEKEKEQS